MKILIVTGFLGSGKTTWIKDFLNRLEDASNFMIVENDFGPINLDAKLLENKKMDIYSLDSGCICCSLKSFFEDSIRDIIQNYMCENIIIEPSGLAILSDLLKSLSRFKAQTKSICLLDGSSWKFLLENHGEYYEDQMCWSNFLIVNRAEISEEKTKEEILIEFPAVTLLDYETSFDLAHKFFFAPINGARSMQKVQDRPNLSKNNHTFDKTLVSQSNSVKTAEDDFQSFSIHVKRQKEGFWEEFFEYNRDLMNDSKCLRMKGIVVENGHKKVIQYSAGEFSFSDFFDEKSYQIDKDKSKGLSKPSFNKRKSIFVNNLEKSNYINKLIFIGKDLDEKKILRVFKSENLLR